MNDRLPAIAAERIQYHPALQERYGIDRSSWRALVESVFPSARTIEGVILALSYCKARNLDVFKRPVHVVPIWDSKKSAYVETVWPGIGELRTTAFRTQLYAGCEEANFGPDITRTFRGTDRDNRAIEETVTFPEWCQITVLRSDRNGAVHRWPGPRVYWLETYQRQSSRSEVPNEMWRRRARGQLEKCAEAAALRKAFPEEIGEEYIGDEAQPMRDITPVKTGEANRDYAEPQEPPDDLDRLAAQHASRQETAASESEQRRSAMQELNRLRQEPDQAQASAPVWTPDSTPTPPEQPERPRNEARVSDFQRAQDDAERKRQTKPPVTVLGKDYPQHGRALKAIEDALYPAEGDGMTAEELRAQADLFVHALDFIASHAANKAQQDAVAKTRKMLDDALAEIGEGGGDPTGNEPEPTEDAGLSDNPAVRNTGVSPTGETLVLGRACKDSAEVYAAVSALLPSEIDSLTDLALFQQAMKPVVEKCSAIHQSAVRGFIDQRRADLSKT